ncbi:MAG TPA: glycosyltransferase family 39 protein [Nitrospiraceae bacterium]|nr:glycosyltransferase family 39 protein [Nitrospiraceae bacterium]
MNLRSHLPHLLALMLLGGLLFFLGLGSLGLTDRDEGSNAEAAREMVETGNWISPTLNYEPRFAKPAFVYWLMSGAYRLFGPSEFAARLPSAVFGLALILLQYLFLTHLRGTVVGLLGGLMLLLNVEIVAIGRMALTDSVLIFFTTLSLFCFWLGLHGEGRQRHFFWLFYFGMAVATLTKGPVGVLVPLLAVVPYLTIAKRWGQLWQKGFPLIGSLLFLLLALPWYITMLAIHGSRYTASAQADTVGRFLNVIGGHGFSVFFYVPVLLFGFFPWSGFLPVAMYEAFKNWRMKRLASSPGGLEREFELELFAALWVAGVFLFFSLSATRLPHYIGPLYPAAAILTASYWHRCLADPHTPGLRASLRTIMGLGYLLAFALAALPSLYSMFVKQIAKEFPVALQIDPGLSPYAAALIVVVGVTLVWYFGLSEQRRAGAFWVAGAVICLVQLIAIQFALPRFNTYFVAPPQELAYTAGLNLGSGDRLILYGSPRPSLIFYAQRKIIVIPPGQEEALRSYLSMPGRTMILLQARLRSNLPAEASSFPLLLERYGYVLLGNEPMVKQIPNSQPSASSRPVFSH